MVGYGYGMRCEIWFGPKDTSYSASAGWVNSMRDGRAESQGSRCLWLCHVLAPWTSGNSGRTR